MLSVPISLINFFDILSECVLESLDMYNVVLWEAFKLIKAPVM